MAVTPYLIFNGNCKEAVYFYADAFQTAPPDILTFADFQKNNEQSMLDGTEKLVRHATLNIEQTTLIFADAIPSESIQSGTQITLAIVSSDSAYLTSAFQALAQEGTVKKPLAPTSFSVLYGIVKDLYGIEWQFNLQTNEAAS